MAGQQPFMAKTNMSSSARTSGLFPSLETALGNSYLLLNQLRGLGMPLQPDANSQREHGTSDMVWDYSHRNSQGRRVMDYDDHRDRMGNYGTRMQRDDPYGIRDRQRNPYYDSRIFSLMGEDSYRDLSREKSFVRYGDRYEEEDYPTQTHHDYSALDRRKSQELSREGLMHSTKPQYGKPVDLSGSKYGLRKNEDIPPLAQLRPNCYIVPPADDSQKRKLSEKPLGCRTIFVGGLPPLTDEFIVNEIFYVCGPIESINLNAGKGVGARKFCHVRFVNRESVEMAVLLAAYQLVIGDGADKDAKCGRIQVDYAKSKEDQREFRDEEKARSQIESLEAESGDKGLFDVKRARSLLEELRKDTAVFKTWQILTQWFEKGECTRTTANTFYSLLSSTHSHIKRLIKERKEHEALVEKEKKQQLMRANVMKQQCEAILNVFEAASKKKSWDHFTKAQRRNITQWFQLIRDEIKLSKEVEIQNREEVGMDLEDEPRAPSEPIEQPALIMSQESQDEQKGTDKPSKPKKQKLDSESESDSSKELQAENEKLRSQVTSLKALAEQNTSLMWSAQSYKQQANAISQQFTLMVKQKDSQISRLTSALQGLQQFVQIIDITEPQRRMSNLEVLVDVSKDDQNVTDMDLDTEETNEENERSKETHAMASEEEKKEVIKEEEASENEDSKTFSENEKEKTEETEKQQSGGQASSDESVKDNDVKVEEEEEEITKEIAQETPEKIAETIELDEESTSNQAKEEDEETTTTIGKGRKRKKGKKPIQQRSEVTEDVATESSEEEKPVRRCTRRNARATRSWTQQEATVVEETKIEESLINKEELEGVNNETEEATYEEEKEVDEDYGRKGIDKDEKKLQDSEEKVQEALVEGKGKAQEGSKFDEDSDGETKRGKPRFVQIDEEQFEVIDDVIEDSDEDEMEMQGDAEETADPETERLSQETQETPAYQPSYESYYGYDQGSATQQYYQSYSWPSSAMPSYSAMDYGPSVVRLSGQELVLVGVMCSYLHVCPSGATVDELTDYLKGQFNQVQKDAVESLLSRLSVVFKGTDRGDGSMKWKFCGFDMARWIGGDSAKTTAS